MVRADYHFNVLITENSELLNRIIPKFRVGLYGQDTKSYRRGGNHERQVMMVPHFQPFWIDMHDWHALMKDWKEITSIKWVPGLRDPFSVDTKMNALSSTVDGYEMVICGTFNKGVKGNQISIR